MDSNPEREVSHRKTLPALTFLLVALMFLSNVVVWQGYNVFAGFMDTAVVVILSVYAALVFGVVFLGGLTALKVLTGVGLFDGGGENDG